MSGGTKNGLTDILAAIPRFLTDRGGKMLTDTALKALKPRDKKYKVTDRDGMYVLVMPACFEPDRRSWRSSVSTATGSRHASRTRKRTRYCN